MDKFKPISKVQPLPSGVTVEIGEWTVGDIANMGKRGSLGIVDHMIERCKLLEDPFEIYPFLKPGDKLKPLKLMTGDRAAVMMYQRILTHWQSCGPHFEFSFPCQNDFCRDENPKNVPWSVDLRRFLLSYDDIFTDPLTPDNSDNLGELEELPLWINNKESLLWVERFGDMPIEFGSEGEEERIAFLQCIDEKLIEGWKNGNRFEYQDPYTGETLFWKILTGQDEAYLRKFQKEPDKMKIQALGRRIVEIEGIPSFQKLQWLSDWKAGADSEFQEFLNGLEPGMFQEFDVQCPRCQTVQEVSFPLDLSFFSPSKRRKKRGKRS